MSKKRILIIVVAIILGVFISQITFNNDPKIETQTENNEDIRESNSSKTKELTKEINSLKEENKALNSEIERTKLKDDETIKSKSVEFLNTFYNYDSRDKKEVYAKIKPLITEKLYLELVPKDLDSYESDTIYSSKIENIIAYKEIGSLAESLNVFVTFDNTITVDDNGTPNKIRANLGFIFDEDSKTYKVNSFDILK